MNVQKLIREGSPLCFRFQYTSSRMTLITVSPEEQSERQRCAAVPSNIFFFNFAWFTVRRTSDGLIALLWAWGDWWALMTLFGLCMLQIRKRRPTPASLVIMNEHVPPEKDEKRTNISQAESQSASPKQRKQSVYTPPALKGIKHLKSQSDSAFPEEEEGISEREEEWDH
uniref:Uncharacterized protein n=1 Tax=Anser brachyrhynchus TaxID=132585 RepID=A0A8B9I334_9AVES